VAEKSEILVAAGGKVIPASAASPGAPGEQVFTFRAMKAGDEKVTFELRRPWEHDVAPDKALTISVEVR
jgi:predicted secreted protein